MRLTWAQLAEAVHRRRGDPSRCDVIGLSNRLRARSFPAKFSRDVIASFTVSDTDLGQTLPVDAALSGPHGITPPARMMDVTVHTIEEVQGTILYSGQVDFTVAKPGAYSLRFFIDGTEQEFYLPIESVVLT